MDQFGDELKKVLKAGMGAVAAGLEKGQEAIESLAKKGEPLYQQAKAAVSDAADKVAQAVNDGIQSMNAKPQASDVIDLLRGMTRDDWAQVRAALDEFEAQADEADRAAKEASAAAQEIMDAEISQEEEPKAEETTEDPEEPETPEEPEA